MAATNTFAFSRTTPIIELYEDSTEKNDLKSISDSFFNYSNIYKTIYIGAIVDINKYTCLRYPGTNIFDWVRLYISIQNANYDWSYSWTALGQSFDGFYAYRLGVTKIGDPSTIKLDIKILTNF